MSLTLVLEGNIPRFPWTNDRALHPQAHMRAHWQHREDGVDRNTPRASTRAIRRRNHAPHRRTRANFPHPTAQRSAPRKLTCERGLSDRKRVLAGRATRCGRPQWSISVRAILTWRSPLGGENCVVVACRRRLTLWFFEAVYRAGRRMPLLGPSLLPLGRARGSESLSPCDIRRRPHPEMNRCECAVRR